MFPSSVEFIRVLCDHDSPHLNYVNSTLKMSSRARTSILDYFGRVRGSKLRSFFFFFWPCNWIKELVPDLAAKSRSWSLDIKSNHGFGLWTYNKKKDVAARHATKSKSWPLDIKWNQGVYRWGCNCQEIVLGVLWTIARVLVHTTQTCIEGRG